MSDFAAIIIAIPLWAIAIWVVIACVVFVFRKDDGNDE